MILLLIKINPQYGSGWTGNMSVIKVVAKYLNRDIVMININTKSNFRQELSISLYNIDTKYILLYDDVLDKSENRICIFTQNQIEKFDNAFLHQGRIYMIIEFKKMRKILYIFDNNNN